MAVFIASYFLLCIWTPFSTQEWVAFTWSGDVVQWWYCLIHVRCNNWCYGFNNGTLVGWLKRHEMLCTLYSAYGLGCTFIELGLDWMWFLLLLSGYYACQWVSFLFFYHLWVPAVFMSCLCLSSIQILLVITLLALPKQKDLKQLLPWK